MTANVASAASGSHGAHGVGSPVQVRIEGRLDWRAMLQWLVADGVIARDDATSVAQRFGAGASRQHPLVRLGSAGLIHARNGKPLDTELLTEWLAHRAGLPYLRIDPLKVDVGRVADVMSVRYAELRSALPVKVTVRDVTIATSEPFDLAWVPEIESHTRRAVKIVVTAR